MAVEKGTIWRVIGPGVLLAGAAVGVSHLVQATRAGADYHFALLGFLLLACLTKWPFLEYGPRYVAATGENLIEGYRRLGRWAVGVYLIVTLGTMFIIMAAVTAVTAGLAAYLFGIELSPVAWSAILLGVSAVILAAGRYPLLDIFMKVMMAVLAVATLVAVIAAFGVDRGPVEAQIPNVWTYAGFGFLLAMMGWMPIPIDSAVWHTLWRQSRDRQTGHRATLRESLIDYNAGYLVATVLGIAFLALGALVMFGSGAEVPPGGAAFANRLIGMYGQALGEWSLPVIGLAAFITMFSTTIVVLDAYPRVLERMAAMAQGREIHRTGGLYLGFILVLAAIALVIINFLAAELTRLVDYATIMSFLTAPVFAFMNYRVVTSSHMPADARPGAWMRALSWASIVFLLGFSVAFIYWRFAATPL